MHFMLAASIISACCTQGFSQDADPNPQVCRHGCAQKAVIITGSNIGPIGVTSSRLLYKGQQVIASTTIGIPSGVGVELQYRCEIGEHECGPNVYTSSGDKSTTYNWEGFGSTPSGGVQNSPNGNKS